MGSAVFDVEGGGLLSAYQHEVLDGSQGDMNPCPMMSLSLVITNS